MLNTAIIGLGWWGKTLVKAARDFGAPLRFVRGVSLEPDTVRDFAAEHKIALGTSFEEAIADPQVQAIVLATPHTKHPAQVQAAGRRRQAHLLRKALRADRKRTPSPCWRPCKRAGVTIAVGHHFRLMPSMRVLAELKEAGAFGTIMHAEGNYSHDWLASYPADSWRMAAEESRAGGMTGMGIHVLDCFRDMVGPMKRISALSKARALKLPTGDTTAALIEFENGATGTLGTTIKTPFRWRIAIFGENCWAESVSETRAIVRRAGKDAGNHRPAGRQSPRPQSGLFRQGGDGAGRVSDLARGHPADRGRAGGGVQVGRRQRRVDGRVITASRSSPP